MRFLGLEISTSASRRAELDQVAKAAVDAMSSANSRGWVRLVGEGMGGGFQAGMKPDNPDQVLAFSAVFGCVTGIANDVSKLVLRAVEAQADGTRRPIPKSSPLAAFFRRPNHFQNAGQFVNWWVVQKLLTGNTVALKERDGRNMVRALYVLDWPRVTPLVADTGDVFYRLAAEKLAGVPDSITIPAGEAVHDRNYPLFHPLLGVSPLYAAAMSATMGARITTGSATFFGNMSRPSGILTSEQAIAPELAERMKREWRERYAGANLGDIAVGGNGLTYSPITIPAADAQLIEQLKWSAADVAAAFHYPVYKLGGTLPSGAKVEELNQVYYSECLQPILEALEECLTDALELPDGVEAEFDLDGLFRMDQPAMAETEGILVQRGIRSPNEARRRFNSPPVTGGETPYLQQQNFSLAALAKRDAQENPFATGTTPAPKPAAGAEEDPAEPANDDDAGEANAAAFAGMVQRGLA